MKHFTLVVALLVITAPVFAQDGEKKPEVEWTVTDSGIRYQVLKAGDGARPKPGDTVKVHYTGTFEDGKKFDSSRDRGSPFSFMLGVSQVIEGWDLGVAMMNVGARYNFHIPWKLAYGEKGQPGIPPKSDLYFDVELIEVKEGDPLPVFVRGDPERQKKTESGIVWEVLEEGEGAQPKEDQGISAKFALFTDSGRIRACSATMGELAGPVSRVILRVSPRVQLRLRFLQEMAPMMKPGGRYRLEVPPDLIQPALRGDSKSVWEIQLVKVNDIPKFEKPEPEQQKKTDSGLKYEVLNEGDGKSPGPVDVVTVHYTGWLTDGTLFDSSRARGETTSFPLNRVIPGWTEGLQLMKVGSAYRFEIPANLAYGPNSPSGSIIPPNSPLIFLVVLVKIGE